MCADDPLPRQEVDIGSRGVWLAFLSTPMERNRGGCDNHHVFVSAMTMQHKPYQKDREKSWNQLNLLALKSGGPQIPQLRRNLGLESLEKGVHTVAGFQDFAYRLRLAGTWPAARPVSPRWFRRPVKRAVSRSNRKPGRFGTSGSTVLSWFPWFRGRFH